MEPKIVSKPALTVVGMIYRGTNANDEIPELWDQFCPRIKEIKHLTGEDISYGVSRDYDPGTGEFSYLAGLPVSSSVDLPEGMECWEIPEQTYAVFQCTLPAVKEAFQQAEAWLTESEYKRPNTPELELYDKDFAPEQGKLDMAIYIPVKKK